MFTCPVSGDKSVHFSLFMYKTLCLLSKCARQIGATMAVIAVVAPAMAQTPPADAKPSAVSAFPLRRLYIADTLAKVAALKAEPNTGPVVIDGVPLLETKEFEGVVAPYFGQLISMPLLQKLGDDIAAYGRKHDRVLTAALPTQDISSGEFRMIVGVGHYNDLTFKGNRWFSKELLAAKLGVKLGDEIRLSSLDEGINWTNANPFRHVQVMINNLPNQPGASDLIVAVQERIPVRVAASYDDTGNDIVGNNHYTAAVQFGNLWGKDHQGSYQFTTTDDYRLLQGHSADYRVPLPWHHYLQVAAAYSHVDVSFGGPTNNTFTTNAKTYIADLRYVVPIEKAPYSFDFSAGIDFKESNNFTRFGQFKFGGVVDIFQFTLGANAVRRDTKGGWALAVSLNASPGGFNSRNTTGIFQSTTYVDTTDDIALQRPGGRFGAKSRYVYGTVVLQRLTNLPHGFQLATRGQFQVSSNNLLSSEQMGIGGMATVRGYNERIYSGDQGYFVSNELQAPVWTHPLRIKLKKIQPLQTRLLGFWDIGRVTYKHRDINDIALTKLMSIGVGLRSNIGSNFSVSADYGWQLLDTPRPPQPNRDRAHIRVTLAY
jgi:hemolysin activation/secretion protein